MSLSEKTLKILKEVDKVGAALTAGEEKEVVCPVCGGRLFVEKAAYNGHLQAECDGCKFAVME